jgi:hypothetical protein
MKLNKYLKYLNEWGGIDIEKKEKNLDLKLYLQHQK